MKLNFEDKLKIVQLKNRGFTNSLIASKYSVHISTINELIREYRKHGIESLKHKSKNNKYTLEFKLEVIRYYRKINNYSQTALNYNIKIGTIYRWVKNFKELGYNGLTTMQGRPTIMTKKTDVVINNNLNKTEDDKDLKIKELTEQIDTLKMENDLLKKLKALVQQRTQQQDKKK